MRGLFVKDLALLKVQKQFLVLILCLYVGMIVVGDSMLFPIVFMMFICSLLAITSISYDEYDHGYQFLFCLPITRKQYVLEKYALALFYSALALMMNGLMVLGISFFRPEVNVISMMELIGLMIPAVLTIQSFMLPIQLKFGAEKGRVAMIVFFAVLFLLGNLLAPVLESALQAMLPIGKHLSTWSFGLVLSILVLIGLCLMAVSYRLSVSIISKKEF